MRYDCTQWLNGYDWSNSLAVTAHLSDSYTFPKSHQIDQLRQKAYTNNRTFFSYLDRKIYGNAAKPKRGYKQTTRVAVVEIGKQRIHSHFLIICPPHLSSRLMSMYVDECWQKTPQGISDIDIQTNEGTSFEHSFGGYIMKQIRQNDFDAFDTDNTNLPYQP